MNTKFHFVQSLIVAIAISCLMLPVIALSQELKESKTKVVHGWYKFKNEPVRFSNVKVKGVSLNINKEFSSADNWLQDLAIDVENISLKPIVYFEIIILVPNLKGEELPSGERITYGTNRLMTDEVSLSTTEPPLQPGQRREVRLSPDSYNTFKRWVEEGDLLSSINKIYIYASSVIFDDDTMWEAGTILYRDKINKGNWKANPQANLKSLLLTKPNKGRNLAVCGSPETIVETCCANYEGKYCATIYSHKTLSAGTDAKCITQFNGPLCDCFSGRCQNCSYAPCNAKSPGTGPFPY